MTALTNEEIKRLATIAGVRDFKCWQTQMSNAEERIRHDVAGNFLTALTRCMPIWVETGRVRDLSRGVRVPKHWPHYSSLLGDEFARKFRHNYKELITILDDFPQETREYLCVCDLLEAVMYEFYVNDGDIPISIFQIQAAVPEVIQYEFAHEPKFIGHMTNLGSYLQRLHRYDYED